MCATQSVAERLPPPSIRWWWLTDSRWEGPANGSGALAGCWSECIEHEQWDQNGPVPQRGPATREHHPEASEGLAVWGLAGQQDDRKGTRPRFARLERGERSEKADRASPIPRLRSARARARSLLRDAGRQALVRSFDRSHSSIDARPINVSSSAAQSSINLNRLIVTRI